MPLDHVKLPMTDIDACRAFYSAALAPFGWKVVYDDGAEALGFGTGRPYGGTYYAAFVLDPDGHNIEAVWHGR